MQILNVFDLSLSTSLLLFSMSVYFIQERFSIVGHLMLRSSLTCPQNSLLCCMTFIEQSKKPIKSQN